LSLRYILRSAVNKYKKIKLFTLKPNLHPKFRAIEINDIKKLNNK